MPDRKLLTTDFINLKAKVKAEMKRRNQSGSVSSYGESAYDYTTTPTNNGPVKGEHLKKILDPIKAINDTGLPSYPGELTESDIETMELKVDAWKTRSMTDRTASDCKTGCTGTCTTGCSTGCYGCTSCSGCSGCGGSCSTSCKEGDCYGGCSGCSGCGSGCADTCTGGCKGGCNTTCTGGCKTGCLSSCTGTCKPTCAATCASWCTKTTVD